MAMDFFEHQEVARRNTKKLVAIFALGVIAIILSVHAVVSTAAWQGTSRISRSGGPPPDWIDAYLLNPEIFAWVALGVVTVVSAGSLYKLKALGGGGEKVAASLGGTRLDPGSADPDERKVLNVVEEMAIASGVPVPPVFILDQEEGINAFAAGFEPGDAVIGVTRGAAHHLTRDELQGVIAHEFSHILNGDMRLNIRLIGILHGVLLIGIIGRILLRSGAGRRRGGRGKGNQAALVGLALLAIGYLGTLCGNLIKAAVSREREFLADASAVQFTRNPDGIAGALKKLGGLDRGSKISHPRAEELSHMYFGQGIANRLGSLFATHPPLGERVRRIDPSFDGRFVRADGDAALEGTAAEDEVGRGFAASGDERAAAAGLAGTAGLAAGGASEAAGSAVDGRGEERSGSADSPGGRRSPAPPSSGEGPASLDAALSQVGRPTEEHVAYVRRLMASVPDSLRTAAHEREGAEALLYALLMDRAPETRKRQGATLASRVSDSARLRAEELAAEKEELDPNARLPLVDMLIATLKGVDEEDFRRIRDVVRELTEVDGEVDLFEWVVGSMVVRHLDPGAGEERRKGGYTRIQGVSDSVVVLLSALAQAGHETPEGAERAYREGMEALPELVVEGPLDEAACGPQVLEAALDRLSHLVPQQKKRVLEACGKAIAADRQVTTREGELFRVVADWLDCPVPPLLPGQRVA